MDLEGTSIIAQAWRNIRKRVNQANTKKLIDGLGRFQVVGIGLREGIDNPQQIFQTIHATVKPLAESKK